jgi:hypothetical protein
MAACRLPVAGIGYSTVEAVPFYHFLSGADALRILVPPVSTKAPFECDYCDVGELSLEAENVVWGWITCQDIVKLARRWSVSMVFFDGVEPVANVDGEVFREAAAELKRAGISVGLRWQGSRPGPISEEGIIDSVLADYVPGAYLDSSASYRVLKLLETHDPWKSNLHLEVAVHIEKPLMQALTPLVQHVNSKEVPIHVYIYEPYGGGAVVDLYKKLKEKTPYLYIHADPYSELDTYCPKCSSVIAVRTEGVLHTLAAKDGRCPKCGHPLLLRRVANEKTPRRILRETRGETVWYPLESLPVKVDFSSSRGHM